MGAFLTSEGLVALGTLTALEIVLGVDNLVFIAIVSASLPEAKQGLARRLGLALALITRVLLLLTLSWIMGLTEPLFHVPGRGLSGRDLILLLGGLFLVAKATWEIYAKVEVEPHEASAARARAAFVWVLVQILLLDIVFSLDSVITAVGMANQLSIMVTAMVIAMLIMLVSAAAISDFIDRHPSLKILALAFLLLIGVMLVAEGMGSHMEKGYIYFAMAFSLLVELLNMRYRRKHPSRRAAGH